MELKVINTEEGIHNEKIYKEIKFRLENLENKKKSIFRLIYIVVVFLCFIIHYYLHTEFNFKIGVQSISLAVALGALVGVCIKFNVEVLLNITETRLRRNLLYYETENAKDEVDEDIFENSIKMSYKYLDQYYLQTREQAEKGFLITVCVSLFGAMLIGVGIVAMFLEKADPSYVTCASGVITEFIAAIFFYLYNKTITSMSKYHNKLVLSHNISIALKVAESLPDNDKIKSKELIISELLKNVNSYLIKSDSEEKKE